MLQVSAINGKILQGIPQSNKMAKYVDPPPKPTLEYNIAVTKNKNDNISIKINLNLWL